MGQTTETDGARAYRALIEAEFTALTVHGPLWTALEEGHMADPSARRSRSGPSDRRARWPGKATSTGPTRDPDDSSVSVRLGGPVPGLAAG